ncbi:hypothetical protein ACHAWX_006921 [Stephanocyclus meneghinianus]
MTSSHSSKTISDSIPRKSSRPSSILNPDKLSKNPSANLTAPSPRPPASGPGSGKGIDVQPFSRGSVIEVRYIQRHDETNDDGSDWFASDSDEEAPVYLCDIIDRAPLPSNTKHDKRWKYYVHYRDLNRRMDEWIMEDRIVSPPSVGNAKARALKRKKEEEEREKVRKERAAGEKRRSLMMAVSGRRKIAEEEDAVVSGEDDANSTEERRKSRRSVLRRVASSESTDGLLDAAGSQLLAEGNETRLTRRQRRKTGDGEIAAQESIADNSQAEEHFVVDVVTTLAAPTLDEHEGMDEAALKEHEEVTKVKNVATLELGQYQMDTWYFSPLPKELMPRGMIDVLYVDEFSLNFFTRKVELQRFQERELKKGRRHPPGNEIYRCGNLSSEILSYA